MKKADKIDALERLLQYTEQYMGNCSLGFCSLMDFYMPFDIEYHRYYSSMLKKEAKLRGKVYGAEYLWKRGSKAPRIKWINEQIKKLEKK